MNFLLKTIALIYHSFDDRGIDIPHFRAMTTIVFILFLHIMHAGLIFKIPFDQVMPWAFLSKGFGKWFFAMLSYFILIGSLAIVFPRRKLDKVEVTQKQIDRARKAVPCYLFICVLLLAILLVKSGVEKGKISF